VEVLRLVRRAAAGAVFAASAFAFVAALPASAQVAVTVNGAEVDFSPPPIIQGGRVFVPLRGVFERLGASVVYDNGQINATGNGRTISLQIGSTQATIDGQPQTLDVAPFIIGASTFVPLRFVSEALGASVDWDNTEHLVSIATAGEPPPEPSYVEPVSDTYVSEAPPPVPVYEQPYVPAPNYIWQPGFWGWGPYGYYWVPGTWVEAPQPGYLWTPGYWGWSGAGFAWNQGYWALSVGFYGGVNYGGGYFGHGYGGGRWDGDDFRYNTYVTRVDTTIVTNVYVDKTVYVNNSPTRISYNGGPNGLHDRPTPDDLTVAKAPHLGLTPVQQLHIKTAAGDRALLATVNHSKPPVLTVAHPLSLSNPPPGLVPVTERDRVTIPKPGVPAYHPPAIHTAVPYRAPVTPVPAYHAPAVHTAVPYRAPVAPVPEYHPPVVHTALPYRAPVTPVPEYRPPVVHTAPPYRAPVAPVAPVPAYHPPVVHTAPPYHAPPKPLKPAHVAPHPGETEKPK